MFPPRSLTLACSLALCSLALGGCADLLGLGGLTYDLETGGSGGAPNGAQTGGSGGLASGGSSGLASGGSNTGGIVDPEGSGGALTVAFPEVWPRGALVAASWRGMGPAAVDVNSKYWLYVPESGELLSHDFSARPSIYVGRSLTRPGADTLLAAALAGQDAVLLYERPTGLVSFGLAPADDEDFNAELSAGSPGWTHLALTDSLEAPSLLAFDATSQQFRFGPVDLHRPDAEVQSGTWDGSWTEVLGFRVDAQPGVLRLDRVDGRCEFLPSDGKLLGEPLDVGLLPPAWDVAAAVEIDGVTKLLLYWSEDGRVRIAALDPLNQGVNFDDTVLWRKGLTSITPVVLGQPMAITYDAVTSIADVVPLAPLEESSIVLK